MIGSRYQLNPKDTVPGDLPRQSDFSSKLRLIQAAVSDPNPAFRGARQRVMLNIKSDPLLFLRFEGYLDEAEAAAGERYRSVVLKSRKPVTGARQWFAADKVDVTVKRDHAILMNLLAADEATRVIDDACRICGSDGERLLEQVLIEERTFRDLAGFPRKWRFERKLKTSFCNCLKRLSDYWSRYGAIGEFERT